MSAEPTLYLSSSPHVRQGDTTGRIMWTVVMALVPATVWGVLVFGIAAAGVVALAVAGCLVAEAMAQWVRRQPLTLTDGSAALTGVLLALNLPPSSPWWLVLFGSAAAVWLGKQVFGGLGQNPFNPALVARVLLLVSFPVEMTTWTAPGGLVADAVSAATPLGAAKTAVSLGGTLGAAGQVDPWHLFVGLQGGCIGEVSALALLVGAGVLLWKRVIPWDIPVGFVAATLCITAVAWELDPTRTLDPLTHLLSGGLVLGAFYMATDMVTSPLTSKGRWVFGIGCGLLTAVIRLWGGYPEGVSFSILLMNACVPLIDRFTRPTKFGRVAAGGATS